MLAIVKNHKLSISVPPRRTIKYEEVSLKDYATPREARQSLAEYLRFYNERRLHQSLEYHTPAEVSFR
ncbi:MAG: transposase [Ktedonobacteraceae bacterium]|nr:transposase [Ktedonobacteraceae bacterium]